MTANKILLAHGSGGRLSHELIEKLFLANLNNPVLAKMDDAAEITIPSNRIAFSTDAFVVDPFFFPGGDIGKLSVCGTINDLAMKGAMPTGISTAFMIEEGFDFETLQKIVDSLNRTAKTANVPVICGDTKVVEKGSLDKLFIVTSGIGTVISKNEISGKNARIGDAIILSGTIGDHGLSVIQARGQYQFEGTVKSDCAPLNHIVKKLIDFCPEIHVLRDPTRGGLATTLNEIAKSSQVKIEIFEENIPVSVPVRSACNLLGIDPLYVANEGKFIAVIPKNYAEDSLKILKEDPLGTNAVQIGHVTEGKAGVEMVTTIGGRRPLRMLEGEQLPRIC